MKFLVTQPGGMKDPHIEVYARLLRQHGKDLGCLARMADPENPRRRWVHVWNTPDEARQFAATLEDETGDHTWLVESTQSEPSPGPFGPLLFQLARRSDGWVLALHPLSLALIKEAFPPAKPGASLVYSSTQTWAEFQETRRTLRDLVEEIAPALTGISLAQLTDIGFLVLDADTEETWVDVPPAGAVRNVCDNAVPA